MSILDNFKSLFISKKTKDNFIQAFWANEDVAAFSKIYAIKPTEENISRDPKVINKLIKMRQKPNVKFFLQLRKEAVISLSQDDIKYDRPNAIFYYLIQYGALNYKKLDLDVVDDIYELKNNTIQFKVEKPKVNMLVREILEANLFINFLKPEELELIASKIDFKKLLIESNALYFLIKKMAKAPQKSYENYFTHIFDIALKGINIKAIIDHQGDEKVRNMIDVYIAYKEREKIDSLLSKDEASLSKLKRQKI